MDGALLDTWKHRRGFWEAKDINDDLEKEIHNKIEKGYPTTNIILASPMFSFNSLANRRRSAVVSTKRH